MKYFFKMIMPLVFVSLSFGLYAGETEELFAMITGKFVGGFARDYYRALDNSETKEIRFIITTLANASLTKIWHNKGKLETAGDRIDNVHPLKFLEYIFKDEELKVGVYLIKDRGWVASDFFGGVYESLDSEMKVGNMKLEYIQDFAKNVGIEANIITAPIEQSNWSRFIDLLIIHIPRKGDHDRYDI